MKNALYSQIESLEASIRDLEVTNQELEKITPKNEAFFNLTQQKLRLEEEIPDKVTELNKFFMSVPAQQKKFAMAKGEFNRVKSEGE